MDLDLTSVAGIAVAAWALGEFIFRFFQDIAEKYKQLLVLGICVGLGIAVRLTGAGFESIPWIDFILQLIFAVIGAHLIHDKVANPTLLRSRKK